MDIPLFLLLIAVPAFSLAEQLTPVQSKLDQIVYLYPNQTKHESELPECEIAEVCSTEHKRYWLPTWIHRYCRCPSSDCSDNVSFLDNRSQIRVCKTDKEKIDECREKEQGLEVVKGESGREVVKLTCRCGWPKYWALAVHVENSTLYHDRYACISLPRCQSGDFCGHIRADTYSMYLQCVCPQKHICLNKDRTERPIIEALYQGPAIRAYCQPQSEFTENEV